MLPDEGNNAENIERYLPAKR